jgi:hypothetical protein
LFALSLAKGGMGTCLPWVGGPFNVVRESCHDYGIFFLAECGLFFAACGDSVGRYNEQICKFYVAI